MARRRRKGRKKSKPAVPVAMVAPVAYIVWRDFNNTGLAPETLSAITAHLTGYYPTKNEFNVDYAKDFWFGELAGIVVHKVANKVGINRYVRRMSGGWLSI